MEWVTEDFRNRIAAVHGEAGAEWLAGLEGRVGACEQRWEVQVVGPVGKLNYNFTALVRRGDGSRAVLKICPPSPALYSEMAALRHFAGRGAARLLDYDRQAGAMVIEYLQPGRELADLEDDDCATGIAADVMLRLRRPAPDDPDLQNLSGWTRGYQRLRQRYEGRSGPLPERLLSRAEGLFAELTASGGEKMLIHGDMNHSNILEAGGGEWLAIDPFGLVGDPGYEVGAFLYNPLPHLPKRAGLGKILQRRLAILSERLGIEQERLVGWGIAQAMLSACWNLVDSDADWGGTVRVAEALSGYGRIG